MTKKANFFCQRTLKTLAVLAVGFALVLTVRNAQAATTCGATTNTLDRNNPSYVSDVTKDTYTYDMASKLASSNLERGFSLDQKAIYNPIDLSVVESVPSTLYYMDQKTAVVMETLEKTTYTKATASVSFDTVAREAVTLSKEVPTYILPDKSDLNFDSSALTLSSKMSLLSIDNTKYVSTLTKDDLYRMNETGNKLYVKGADAKVLEINAKLNNETSTLNLSFVKPCVETCTETITLSKMSPDYVLADKTDLHFDSGMFMLMSKANVLSINGVEYRNELTKDELLKAAEAGKPIYIMNATTKVVTQVTFKADTYNSTLSLTFTVECQPMCTEKIEMSKANPDYVLADKTDLHFDSGMFMLMSKANVLSINGVEYRNELTKDELLKAAEAGKPIYIMNATTKVVTQVSIKADTNYGILILSITKPCATDTDKDGVTDDKDVCMYDFGKAELDGCPSGARVSVQEIDNISKTSNHLDEALETKVFDLNVGSCAYNIGANPNNYNDIYNKCTAENTKKETYSPNDGKKPRNYISDLVSIGMNKGSKLILVKSPANTDGSYGYVGFELPNVELGQVRDAGFNIVAGKDTYVQTAILTRDSKGVWHSSRRSQVITGSELQIFQSDYENWDASGERIYPFVFMSQGDWELNVCLEVPAGYEIVEPGTCSQTLLANEARVVEFRIADVGSPKTFKVKTKMKIKHNGKNYTLDREINSYNKHANDKRLKQVKGEMIYSLGQGDSLWTVAKNISGSADNNQIKALVVKIAKKNNIAIKEWGIAGTVSSRTLSVNQNLNVTGLE